MTESRQNYREITVQDVNITETTEAIEHFTFHSLNISQFTISCCLHAKPKDAKKARETFV